MGSEMCIRDRCFAYQLPWETTLIAGSWYDAHDNPVQEFSRGGPVSVDLLQNMYNSNPFNSTYTFRNQLNFDHSLSVSDGGYYSCNVSVELTYPDDSTATLSNSTLFPLIIEGEFEHCIVSGDNLYTCKFCVHSVHL